MSGDYGYDAPYALVIFGIFAVISGIITTTAWWQGLQVARVAVSSTPRDAASFSSGKASSRSGWHAIADALRTLGASNVERRRLGWRFWWGNPVAATTLLTASQAAQTPAR